MPVSIDSFMNTRGGPDGPFLHIGVAVSGGSDSTALLILCRDWALAENIQLTAFTVDHGLRPEAAGEARQVEALCQTLGVSHLTLQWTGWNGQGNVQDAARQARYRLLAEAAKTARCDAVALGHTKDDQAETFLMRLARGSGVDGLSAMRDDWQAEGMRWLRPLLNTRREELRSLLRERGVSWSEDPSNADPRFERVKMRQAMQDLGALGLDVNRLAGTADAMSTARDALAHLAHEAAQKICRVEAGDVVIDPAPFWSLPIETRDRIVAEAIRFVSSTPYRPRLSSLRGAIAGARSGQKSTLQGCLIHPHHTGLRITREHAAVSGLTSQPGEVWDHRWVLETNDAGEIRALGEGISQIKDWRSCKIPRPTLMSSPALWSITHVIAAPLVQESKNCGIVSAPSLTDFLSSFLSH
ncbi:tRNA lysidine(34) synthetase TilS [Aliiroseovarius sp. KMU-50]|uniref:tRNA(Ile)-lysidine synthase n=1 Tax=Aliiroseovarius salicola TaxID=3009082 RepID=A0ABT4W0H6_9RHOB|nr:tRNA lysidine(34) synthetase TilS [Aliiroseovarius sp. KMU-50]MDA5094002.1 tRNA lysidine(34) synthetase TilS [Aliiroseovarius sp. KMU-50]